MSDVPGLDDAKVHDDEIAELMRERDEAIAQADMLEGMWKRAEAERDRLRAIVERNRETAKSVHDKFLRPCVKERNRLRESLSELVALKGIKERMEAGTATGAERAIYESKKPGAWQAARAALAREDKA